MRNHLVQKILACILMLFMFGAVCASPARAIPDLDLESSSAILLESARGQILYKKNPNNKLHISLASKIMTALLAIEKSKPDAKVTISKESAGADGSLLSLDVGEKYTVEDLIYAIILTPANDAASALAEYVGGDANKFVDMMNAKAKELNLKNTHFTNPTGLHHNDQYTTANDLALLMKYALNNETFFAFFSTKAKPWITENGSQILINSNKLFWSYNGIEGGKTGYNKKELQTAITVAKRGEMRLIAIVLDSPEESLFEDSTKILDFGFEHFRTGVLVESNHPIKTITVEDKVIGLVSKDDVLYTYPVGENYIKNIDFKINNDISLPIKRDSILGVARYTLKDDTFIDINLYPDTEILLPESFYSKMVKRITEYRDIFLLVIFLLCIEVVLLLGSLTKWISSKFIGKKPHKSQ